MRLTSSRHDGVDGEAPAPPVHRAVAGELPLEFVSGDPQLAGPVGPLAACSAQRRDATIIWEQTGFTRRPFGPWVLTRSHGDDPIGSVHDGQRVVASLGGTLPVELDPQTLGACQAGKKTRNVVRIRSSRAAPNVLLFRFKASIEFQQ